MSKIPNVARFYTRDYLLVQGDGTAYAKGFQLNPILKHSLDFAGNLQGKYVLDEACGRGELIYTIVTRGARGVGIDFSEDSINLSNQLKKRLPSKIQKNLSYKLMDIQKLNFPDNTFDLVFLMDVVEHLPQSKLEKAIKEASRVTKPGGKVIIHTIPNALFTQTGYRLAKLLFGIKKWNSSLYHINEQSYFSLNRMLNKLHLNGKVIIERVPNYFAIEIGNNNLLKKQLGPGLISKNLMSFTKFLDKIFDSTIGHFIVGLFPLNLFFGTDFWVIITK